MKKRASSQAAWALLTEGVSSARVEAHRLRHLVDRGSRIIENHPKKEKIYREVGDLVFGIPQRLSLIESILDRTSYALSLMGQDFIRGRITQDDRLKVEDAVESAHAFGGARRKAYSPPASQLPGYTTYVDENSKKNLPGDTGKPSQYNYETRPNAPDHKEQALPITPEHKKERDVHLPLPDKQSPPLGINGPGPSSEGKPINYRTKGQKGEEYGHPYKTWVTPRRTMESSISRVAQQYYTMYRDQTYPENLKQNWENSSGKGVPRGDVSEKPYYDGTTTWVTPQTGKPGEYEKRDTKNPGTKVEQPEVLNAPGPGRVIPNGYNYDYENKKCASEVDEVEAAGMFPKQRQRRQRGPARAKSRREYRRTRMKRLRKQKKRYRVQRNKPSYRRKMKMRRKYPNRFRRKWASGDDYLRSTLIKIAYEDKELRPLLLPLLIEDE